MIVSSPLPELDCTAVKRLWRRGYPGRSGVNEWTEVEFPPCKWVRSFVKTILPLTIPPKRNGAVNSRWITDSRFYPNIYAAFSLMSMGKEQNWLPDFSLELNNTVIVSIVRARGYRKVATESLSCLLNGWEHGHQAKRHMHSSSLSLFRAHATKYRGKT